MRKWLTVDQAAEALGLHRSTVIRQIGEGTIRGARRVGRQWRIPADAVEPPPAAPGAGALGVATRDGWLAAPALEAALSALAEAVAAVDQAEAEHKIGSPEDVAARAEVVALAARVVRQARVLGLVEVPR